jgi:redox-sensitive bicupin YhaK (pirin superfamily)
MTAGRGVVHSERTPEELRDVPRRSHGLQLWLALPQAHEEDAASFQHVPGQALGTRAVDTGVTASVLIGRAFGMVSAVRVCSPTLLVQFEVDAVREASWVVPALAAEQALFSPEQDFELDDHAVAAGTLAVLEPGQTCQVRARAGSRLMLLGGTPLGPRLVVWNFVSSSAQRIARAREDWIAQRFDPVPGESGFIPYPGVKG